MVNRFTLTWKRFHFFILKPAFEKWYIYDCG